MRFIDALYKYEEITRNNKEIFYQHDGRVYMRTEENAAGGRFCGLFR